MITLISFININKSYTTYNSFLFYFNGGEIMITLCESYDASNVFYSLNNPDRIASNWIGPTKVGNVTINDYMK